MLNGKVEKCYMEALEDIRGQKKLTAAPLEQETGGTPGTQQELVNKYKQLTYDKFNNRYPLAIIEIVFNNTSKSSYIANRA